MRSRNHRSAPKGNISYKKWLQFFTWLVALAVEEKLCSSFLHYYNLSAEKGFQVS